VWHSGNNGAPSIKENVKNLTEKGRLMNQYPNPTKVGAKMSYEIVKDKVLQDAWRVEAIGPEGEVYVTVFFEPLAEQRAKEYVALMSHQHELQTA
jgi:hypothetical protein